MWQKCPICNGEGVVANNGYVNSLFSVCPTCCGARIISEISGLPPAYTQVKKDDVKTKLEKNGKV